jgi:hypothetical protein
LFQSGKRKLDGYTLLQPLFMNAVYSLHVS